MKTFPNFLLLITAIFLTMAVRGEADELFKIQGTLKGPNGVPAKGILLQFADGNGAITNGLGQYTIIVPSGYSGTLTPPNCTPASRTFSNVTSDQISQDFTARAQITGNVGAGGVAVSGDDGDFATSDGAGNFSLDFPPSGSASFTPEVPGLIFNPTVLSWKPGTFTSLTASAASRSEERR